jgi:hypothetical protein
MNLRNRHLTTDHIQHTVKARLDFIFNHIFRFEPLNVKCPSLVWRTALGLQVFPIMQRATIGRSDSCDITLDDTFASRIHCVVKAGEHQWHLIDLNSRNGTWRNDKRIDTSYLSIGDLIRVGNTHLVYVEPFQDPNLLAEIRYDLPEGC